ncbi:MAG: thioredoxin [Bacteroidetes bacterium]|nr:thioredoxin [Bacteroidota bacterium]
MKKLIATISLALLFSSQFIIAQDEEKVKPEHLTVETFKEKVFDYETNSDQWVFEGDKPCIVDFYADWCKPCKLIAPIMEELAEEYKGQVNIYKVNTEEQRELSRVFGIRSIPSVLFIPMEGKPQMTQGALPKETFKQVIDEFLLGKKVDE